MQAGHAGLDGVDAEAVQFGFQQGLDALGAADEERVL